VCTYLVFAVKGSREKKEKEGKGGSTNPLHGINRIPDRRRKHILRRKTIRNTHNCNAHVHQHSEILLRELGRAEDVAPAVEVNEQRPAIFFRRGLGLIHHTPNRTPIAHRDLNLRFRFSGPGSGLYDACFDLLRDLCLDRGTQRRSRGVGAQRRDWRDLREDLCVGH